MGLREYRRKRDFAKTKEPRGKVAANSHKQPMFVVQKHAASHLHYDFRLELDGVLKSWAVPKGPDTDPAQKRLAMHVEDHPVEYGSFEGIIPAGEYGGGTVMLWDRGTWEPLEKNPQESYRQGRLKFMLHGEKLRGGWMLVRKGGRSASPDERHWFLFKERDEYAGEKRPITEKLPLSVATGRDLDQIAAEADRVWGRHGEEKHAKKRAKAKTAVRVTMPPKSRRAPKPKTSEIIAGDVRLTHPEKILFPEQGLTKLDLAEYYVQVAEWILPHVKGRPLALVRCPEGRGKPCFFQKHPSQGGPTRLQSVDISESGPAEFNMTIQDTEGLVELVQMGVLEIHVWGSTAKHIEKPDRLIFDLDPDPAVSWGDVIRAAKEVKGFLDELGLESFLKTTGGKGLHLVVPVQPRTEWDEAKSFCKAVADLIVRAAPDRYLATMSKAARKGKIFIDYLRNGRGATAVAPYSTRAREGAPISVPIAWSELSTSLRSDQFTVTNIFNRLNRLKRDPWAEIGSVKQSLSKTLIKKVKGLANGSDT